MSELKLNNPEFWLIKARLLGYQSTSGEAERAVGGLPHLAPLERARCSAHRGCLRSWCGSCPSVRAWWWAAASWAAPAGSRWPGTAWRSAAAGCCSSRWSCRGGKQPRWDNWPAQPEIPPALKRVNPMNPSIVCVFNDRMNTSHGLNIPGVRVCGLRPVHVHKGTSSTRGHWLASWLPSGLAW